MSSRYRQLNKSQANLEAQGGTVRNLSPPPYTSPLLVPPFGALPIQYLSQPLDQGVHLNRGVGGVLGEQSEGWPWAGLSIGKGAVQGIVVKSIRCNGAKRKGNQSKEPAGARNSSSNIFDKGVYRDVRYF